MARYGSFGPDADHEYAAYLDTLTLDRAASADLLFTWIADMTDDELYGDRGYAALQAVGAVAERSSIDLLTDVVAREVPACTGDDPHLPLCNRAAIAHQFALESFEQIVNRYREPEVIAQFRGVLDDVIDRRESDHLVVVACRILVRYAPDPEAERAALRGRLGTASHLADVSDVDQLAEAGALSVGEER